MKLKTISTFSLKVSGLLMSLFYLLWMNWHNQIPVDAGDGLIHYSIAKQSWVEHKYFIDHWGKPLFTLLSSGFAQISFAWYTAFNCLVFALTCFFAFKVFHQFKLGFVYYILFPILLVCVPDYVYCVLAGMTEPLFGLLLVASIYLAFSQKWILFAIVVSLMPFSRSEGMLVVVLGLVLLLFVMEWKAIPFLAFGFVIYAIIGGVFFDSFWWYLDSPYPEDSIYGSGPWYHYLMTWANHFGLITLFLFPFGMFGCYVAWKKRHTNNFALIFLFGMAVWAGIIAVHSVFWAFGMQGSAGLTRIASLGLPVALLFILIGCHFVTRELNKIPHIAMSILLLLLINKELSELLYPIKANPFEAELIEAAVFAEKNYPNERIYYFHPIIPWKLNCGVKDTDTRLEQKFFNGNIDFVMGLKPGSLVIRDPQFGPVEQGLTLALVEEAKHKLIPIKVITTKLPYTVYTGEKVQVVVYRVAP